MISAPPIRYIIILEYNSSQNPKKNNTVYENHILLSSKKTERPALRPNYIRTRLRLTDSQSYKRHIFYSWEFINFNEFTFIYNCQCTQVKTYKNILI